MKKRSRAAPAATLRDAYRVAGFWVLAQIESYDELEHPAFVLTLRRRSKKRNAADAARYVAAITASGGDGRAISRAVDGRSTSISPCIA
jgi:hypothetical protein